MPFVVPSGAVSGSDRPSWNDKLIPKKRDGMETQGCKPGMREGDVDADVVREGRRVPRRPSEFTELQKRDEASEATGAPDLASVTSKTAYPRRGMVPVSVPGSVPESARGSRRCFASELMRASAATTSRPPASSGW